MGDTLLEIYVIFRHADRTPDLDCLYPTDPHKDFDYFPHGHGQLTNRGKERAYSFGEILRRKYGGFLGKTYTPGILEAWASAYERTQATLQLVLAALFPPRGDQVWHTTLDWQPIPYRSYSRNDDKLFLGFFNPLAMEVYDKYLDGPGKNIVETHSSFFQYSQKNSGLEIGSPRQVLLLTSALSSQKNMGLTLPSWVENLWPDSFMDLVQCEYDILSCTPRFKYFTIGKLLDNITTSSKLKADGQSKCKLYLYSGHEFTLAVLLRSLGTTYRRMPSYCANLILEHHNINGTHGFKIYYQTDLEKDAELLEVPNCGTFCSIDKFVWYFQDVLKERELNPNF